MKFRGTSKASSPYRLRREITALLVVKIAIILIAGFTIFGKTHRVHVDTVKMTHQLLDTPTSVTTPPIDQTTNQTAPQGTR